MEGSDEFLSGISSIPDMESFNMEGFDMNMDFNMEDFPDMPSFNNDFNMDGIGNLADDDLADFRDISEEENHLGQQDSEESSGNESKTACTEVDEDGSSGEQEIMSDGSITPYETLFDESDNDNGHLPDVENEEDTSLSSQERENSNILDKNQKLLAILSQRKTEAFYKLPKRKDSEDSSLSQEGELISQKPQKSSMKRTNKKGLRSKEKKNVEFALPKESLRKLRYGQDGRAQTEVEAQAHDYFEQKKFPRMNFDVYRHRRNQQDVFETQSLYQSRLNLQKLTSSKKKKAETLEEMGNARERQGKILEEVGTLEASEINAEALVRSFDQRWKKEKKSYETLREELDKSSCARDKQIFLNSSVALKNQLLEQARQEWIKRKEDFRRRKECAEAKIRSYASLQR